MDWGPEIIFTSSQTLFTVPCHLQLSFEIEIVWFFPDKWFEEFPTH